MDKATDEKTAIENKQREDRAHREKEGIEWYPRFFEQAKTEDYEFKGVQG
jgi:hypothetical protein